MVLFCVVLTQHLKTLDMKQQKLSEILTKDITIIMVLNALDKVICTIIK